MTRLTLFILMALSLTLASCESRRSKLDRRNLIPEDQLVPILTDLYMTDGMLGMPRIVMHYTTLDSVSTYDYIIEKHGYTRAMMDKTLKYYFIKDPKKLIKIYDKVLAVLSVMEAREKKELEKSRAKDENLWPGYDSYSYPDSYGTDSALFDITLRRPGYYLLSETVTLYPDDQSLNAGLTAFTCNADSIETGTRIYIKPVRYIKDGQPHNYSAVFKVPLKTAIHIRGNLYDYDNNPETWEKHLVIQNISLTFSIVIP